MNKRIFKLWPYAAVAAGAAAAALPLAKPEWLKSNTQQSREDSQSDSDSTPHSGNTPPASLLQYKKFHSNDTHDFQKCIREAKDLCIRVKDECGIPGMIVAVARDGEILWSNGFGYADLENRVRCHPQTVMRIASISKPITMLAVAKLWEEGKLDLDKPVQEYVPSYPKKSFEGNEVTITTRHLVSHMSGIRHYRGLIDPEEKGKNDRKNPALHDTAYKEFLLNRNFESVEKSLELFKDDDLLFKPGTSYTYTTHGWTLVSAVIEGVTHVPFTTHMKHIFKELGLRNTYLDENEPLIYHRSRYYTKQKGRIINAPSVNNSYKWAGGGYLSNVGDLIQFGNAMLYSYQRKDDVDNDPGRAAKLLPGYLKSSTVDMVWTPVPLTKDGKYAMGWSVVKPGQTYGFCLNTPHVVSHSGGAIGASSALVIVPTKSSEHSGELPSGMVVAIIVNLDNVGVVPLAVKLAKLFQNVQ